MNPLLNFINLVCMLMNAWIFSIRGMHGRKLKSHGFRFMIGNHECLKFGFKYCGNEVLAQYLVVNYLEFSWNSCCVRGILVMNVTIVVEKEMYRR